jgi:alanine racemase
MPGETVGYSATFSPAVPSMIATVLGGYADGLLRTLSNKAVLWDGDTPCPVVGRVSMDAITVDISHLETVPRSLDILGPHQGIDDLATTAGTISYEILTRLSSRLNRRYVEGGA